MNQMQHEIVTRETTHINNLKRFETIILQKTQEIEQRKLAFANQFRFNDAKVEAESLARHCSKFIQEIDDVRSNALCDVDGVLFEFRTADNVNHKAMSKIVQKRKKRIEDRVLDLTRLTRELQQSLGFVRHLQVFDTVLEAEQNELTAMTGKKVCPFCNEAVAIPDWLMHANERHAKECRMITTESERETFDKKNAKDEFQRSSRHTSPTATATPTSSTSSFNNGGSGGRGFYGGGGRGGGNGGGTSAPTSSVGQTPQQQHGCDSLDRGRLRLRRMHARAQDRSSSQGAHSDRTRWNIGEVMLEAGSQHVLQVGRALLIVAGVR